MPDDNETQRQASIGVISALCGIEGRTTGTDAERRAANLLADRLRAMGRKAQIQATYVHPQWAAVHAVHCMLAIGGSLVAIEQPAIGFAIVLAAATSLYLDLEARAYLLRRLFFRRGSQNVVSPGRRPDAPVRLLLVAHYDAPRSGYALGRRAELIARWLPERWRARLGPWRLIFWGGMAPLLPVLGARMAGVDSSLVSLAQLLPTLLLVVGAFLLADIALSAATPGAYENASGVACALGAAERLDADPPANLDVWVVLTGAGEAAAQGMRAFLSGGPDGLDPERTGVICADGVSWGTVHYTTSEGAIVSQPMDLRLIEIAEAIAAAEAEGHSAAESEDSTEDAASPPATIPRPFRTARVTDGSVAAARGLHAITISGRDRGLPPAWHRTPGDEPSRVDPASLERATEFAVNLARQLDADVGRRLG